MNDHLNELMKWIESSSEMDGQNILDHVCTFLRDNVDTYNWVGVYIVNGGMLKLQSFAGPDTEHKEIKIGDGLCSLAVLKNATVNEPSVKSNSDYLACFPSTESELVVPVMKDGKSIGEIDIDSDTKAAFGINDERDIAVLAEKLRDIIFPLYME